MESSRMKTALPILIIAILIIMLVKLTVMHDDIATLSVNQVVLQKDLEPWVITNASGDIEISDDTIRTKDIDVNDAFLVFDDVLFRDDAITTLEGWGRSLTIGCEGGQDVTIDLSGDEVTVTGATEEGARIFFNEMLKPMIDDYILAKEKS